MFKITTLCRTVLAFFMIVAYPLLSAAKVHQASPKETVKGIVCGDLNQNGACDADEPGVSGVMVSNQREVVLTDENGYYQLPVEEEMIIFVTKPDGYELPLNENNLPQFYYIHQPKGSPDLEFSGIAPTGPLPASVDFCLIPSAKKESFSAVVVADPTLSELVIPYYRDGVVSELTNVEADFTMVLEDIMADDLSFYDRYNSMMKTLDMPVFNIVGNHDVNFIDQGNRYAKETYKKHYGPSYFSFDYGDVHFVALDNIDYLGRDNRPYYRGYLDKTSLEWVSNNLKYVDKDKLIVLMAHIPLYSMDTDAISNSTVNRTELIGLLEEFDKVLFFCGHRHLTFHHFLDEKFGRKNPNPIHHIAATAAAGGWWRGPENIHGIPVSTQNDGNPNGYHIFRFNGNTYQERYKATGMDPEYQFRIESPASSLTEAEYNEAELIVNVFNGNENSVVKFRINETDDCHTMQRQDVYDSPFITNADWIKPMATNHIWKSQLPDLPKEIHKISVWTRDMYGQEFTGSKIIEIK